MLELYFHLPCLISVVSICRQSLNPNVKLNAALDAETDDGIEVNGSAEEDASEDEGASEEESAEEDGSSDEDESAEEQGDDDEWEDESNASDDAVNSEEENDQLQTMRAQVETALGADTYDDAVSMLRRARRQFCR